MSSAASTKKVKGCLEKPLPFSFSNPSSFAISVNMSFSFWKKPYFLSATSFVGFMGNDSFGYFINAPRVA